MHIGFRYHVATLVAVFFSLFIGILVGSIIFQDDLLVQEQNSIITELEERFKQLELKTKALQNDLKQAQAKEQLLTEGWNQIRTAVLQERLDGKQVLIFNDVPGSAQVKRMTALLEEAGAEVYGSYIWPDTKFELAQQLEEMPINELAEPIVVVWVEGALSDVARQGLDHFLKLGWQCTLLQPYTSTVVLEDFAANALVIDMADTFLGEISLIRGLAQGKKGIYGRSQGTLKFFL